MKFSAKRVAQGILLFVSLVLILVIVFPHVFANAMNEFSASAPSLSLFAGLLFMASSAIYPVGILALSSTEMPLLQIVQVVGIVGLTALWCFVIEYVAEFISQYKKSGASARITFTAYENIVKFVGVIVVTFLSVNVINLLYMTFLQPTDPSEYSMIPVTPAFFFVNLLFSVPSHLIIAFIVLFLIKKIYHNNVALKEEQDSIV